MQANTLETKVTDFLAHKRIAVAGVSRDDSHHPAATLIYRRLKKTGHDVFAVNPHMQSFDGDRCYPDLRSIPGGVDGVIAGACPLMFGPGADFGHTCMRLFMKFRGRLPT